MTTPYPPDPSGVHRLRLPVTELAVYLELHPIRVGYAVEIELFDRGVLMGYALAYPNGRIPARTTARCRSR